MTTATVQGTPAQLLIDQTQRLFELLFDPSETILVRPIETWTEGGKKRTRTLWKRTSHVQCRSIADRPMVMLSWWRMSESEHANLFFGVCPRFGGGGKFDQAWQIRTVRSLWSDVDDCLPDEALERCGKAGLPEPSVVISSGNGVHLYWKLDAPHLIDDIDVPPAVEIEWREISGKKKPIKYFINAAGDKCYLSNPTTGKSIARNVPRLSDKAVHLQDTLKGIASKIGGDHTTDLSRLLRLPGSLNRKDERNGREPKQCTLVECSGTSYSIKRFQQFAVESPDRQKRERMAKVPLPAIRERMAATIQDKLAERIAMCEMAEDRSGADFSLCAFAIEKGIDRGDLWSRVQGVGKFAERGEGYFDLTWNKAADRTREQLYQKLEQKAAGQLSRANGNGRKSGDVEPIPLSEQGKTTIDGFDMTTAVVMPDQQTDVANARRLVRLHGQNFRYCHPWKKALIWDGARHRSDDTGALQRFAKNVSDDIWNEAKEFDNDKAKMFAARSASEKSVKAMIGLAISENGIPVLHSELDTDPWLFNCANGTVDLRTGNLRPHSRNDLITKLCPTNFNPDAESFTWDRFLESIFNGKQDLIDFMQRWSGYCLTGVVRDQALPIWWGSGANGKSTFIEAFMHAIGSDYAMKAPPDLFMTKPGNSHPTERADLFGKRFVAAVETGDGRRLNEALVKELTGGDTIRARRMREDYWEFAPTHKAIICSNHKPEVRGTDHAIWRRLWLVPFNMTFWNSDKDESGPEELRQDKSLPDKLRAESEGILAWAVRGCLEWQAQGLGEPQDVLTATEEYRSDQNIIEQFINSECLRGSDVYKVRASSLYGAYKRWCEDNGEHLETQRKFGTKLTEMGFERFTNNGTWYQQIAIRA